MRKPKAAPKKPAGAKGGGNAPAPGKRGLVARKPILVTSASHHAHAGGTKKTGKHPHHPHHAPAKKVAPKKRKLSPGSDVACCSAQALGTLLGWDWDRVLEMYWRTASDPDAGATIADTLAAAEIQASGLNLEFGWPEFKVPLILGVQLEEPHAIAVTPDGTWWSWGEPFNPDGWPGLVIEEAWAVRT